MERLRKDEFLGIAVALRTVRGDVSSRGIIDGELRSSPGFQNTQIPQDVVVHQPTGILGLIVAFRLDSSRPLNARNPITVNYFRRAQRGVEHARKRSIVRREIIVVVTLILDISGVHKRNRSGSSGRLWLTFRWRLRLILCANRYGSREKREGEGQGYKDEFARSHNHSSALGNHDYIAGLKKNILLGKISLNDFLVVERMLHLFSIFRSKHVNILELGKLREPARAGKRQQHGHVGQKKKRAGAGDFTGDVDAAAVDFGHS